MTTDMERELRELFRDKAGEAPVSTLGTSGGAPQQVLRRGRRRQVGTVLGSAVVAVLLAVGSFAGLRSVLRDSDQFESGQRYEVFERIATIEAFTITSPSDWFLVNEWPLSMQMAVGSGSASEECTVGVEPPVCTGNEETSVQPLPSGLPMIQLSNVDMGLSTIACRDGLPDDAAVLYVGMDYERAIQGIADPSMRPWPGVASEETGACGPGSYTRFTVNGEPFFAWIGFGESVNEDDRSTLLATYESLAVDDSWEPRQPDVVTPGYVIAGGATEPGAPWALEVRPGDDVEFTLFVDGTSGRTDISLGSEPVSWCCTLKAEPDRAADVVFGVVRKRTTGVEFRPTSGGAIAGTVLPPPPSLGLTHLDVFFIEGAEGLTGDVRALGLEEQPTEPPPITTDRADDVRLSGALLGQDWRARFTGAFADESACIRVTIDEAYEPLCVDQLETSLAGTRPSLHVWVTNELTMFAGSVPWDVVDIRFTSDDGTTPPMELQCTDGPAGWTDPDKKVCAIALPPEGSGTLEFLDGEGAVLFEEGNGWGSATAEGPTVVRANSLSVIAIEEGKDVCLEVVELALRRCSSADLSETPALWAETVDLTSGQSLVVWGAVPSRFDVFTFEGTGFFEDYPVGRDRDPRYPGASFVLHQAPHLSGLCGPTIRLLDFEDGELMYTLPSCQRD